MATMKYNTQHAPCAKRTQMTSEGRRLASFHAAKCCLSATCLLFDDPKVKGKLLIKEDEAKVVRDILHMRAQKQTIYAITKYLI
jgi:hypothetical protein